MKTIKTAVVLSCLALAATGFARPDKPNYDHSDNYSVRETPLSMRTFDSYIDFRVGCELNSEEACLEAVDALKNKVSLSIFTDYFHSVPGRDWIRVTDHENYSGLALGKSSFSIIGLSDGEFLVNLYAHIGEPAATLEIMPEIMALHKRLKEELNVRITWSKSVGQNAAAVRAALNAMASAEFMVVPAGTKIIRIVDGSGVRITGQAGQDLQIEVGTQASAQDISNSLKQYFNTLETAQE